MTTTRPRLRKYLLYSVIVCFVSLGVVAAAYAQSPQDRFRPLLGGIQIQNNGWWNELIGTIGFSAYHFEHIPGIGTLYYYGFVTASHLTSVNEQVYQPYIDWPADNNYVGYTERDPGFPRYSDSVFIYTETVLNGPSTTVSPHIFVFQVPNPSVRGYRSRSEMYVDLRVIKMGRTTGVTAGPITDLPPQVDVGGGIVINNPVLADYNSDAGDSGGVVYRYGDDVYSVLVYGVHSGSVYDIGGVKYRVFSPTDGVLADLGVNVYTE